MRYEFLTDEEINNLSQLPGVLTDKTYTAPISNKEIDELRDFYITKTRPYNRDSNSNIVIQMMQKISKLPEDSFNKNVSIENGYEISLFPKGTLFYKALIWFYDTNPSIKRIWVGPIKVANDYLHTYFGGILAYRAIKEVRMFRMNNTNLYKLYKDNETPQKIKTLIEDIFGIGLSLKERILKKKSPTYLLKEVDCYDNAMISEYGVLDGSKFRNMQHELIDYLESRFRCNSTFLPPMAGPLVGCMREEVTIISDDIEVDKENEYSWMNWGLKDIENIKSFAINENYSNMNFKLVRWLKEYVNPIIDYCDVLSINVHMFRPVVKVSSVVGSESSMIDEFIKYVNLVKPKILCIQELPKEAIKKIYTECNFPYHWNVNNGSHDDSMKLAVFSKINAKAQIINKKYDKQRGIIVLEISGRKLLFTHGPIGKSYLRGKKKLTWVEKFYKAFYINKKLRAQYIRDLLWLRTDFMIGDFNFLPQDKQSKLFEQAGYKTYDIDTPTSIHDVKVDYIWTKLDGKQRVYNWIYSDHRPIGFTFKQPILLPRKGGNDVQYKLNISIKFIVVIVAVIVVLFILLIKNYIKCYFPIQSFSYPPQNSANYINLEI